MIISPSILVLICAICCCTIYIRKKKKQPQMSKKKAETPRITLEQINQVLVMEKFDPDQFDISCSLCSANFIHN